MKEPNRRKVGRVVYWPTHVRRLKDGTEDITWGPMPGQVPEKPDEQERLI